MTWNRVEAPQGEKKIDLPGTREIFSLSLFYTSVYIYIYIYIYIYASNIVFNLIHYQH